MPKLTPIRSWKKFFRIPVADLAGDAHSEPAHIKTGDWPDAGFLGENAFPKTIDAFADASDWTEAGDDNACSIHAVTLFVRASR